jgi:hypothetical protein
MLLTQKAFAEGSRAMAYYCGMLADVSRMKGGTPEAEQAEFLLELLTPICKAFFTDLAHESCNLGMQVFGGHGYIREHGMEQFARDTRILQMAVPASHRHPCAETRSCAGRRAARATPTVAAGRRARAANARRRCRAPAATPYGPPS